MFRTFLLICVFVAYAHARESHVGHLETGNVLLKVESVHIPFAFLAPVSHTVVYKGEPGVTRITYVEVEDQSVLQTGFNTVNYDFLYYDGEKYGVNVRINSVIGLPIQAKLKVYGFGQYQP